MSFEVCSKQGLSPGAFVVASLLCVHLGCSLRSLEYLQRGVPSDAGAGEKGRSADAPRIGGDGASAGKDGAGAGRGDGGLGGAGGAGTYPETGGAGTNSDTNPRPGSGGAGGDGGLTDPGSGAGGGAGRQTESSQGGAGGGGSTKPASGGTSGGGGDTKPASSRVDGGGDNPDSRVGETGGSFDARDGRSQEALADLAKDSPPDLPNLPVDARDASWPDSPDTAEDAPPDSTPGLTLSWYDEFNGVANSGVDTTKWSYVTWGPQNGVNNEEQQYTTSPQNVFLDGNGHLVIRALNTPVQNADYTSGRIETKGKYSFKTGRLEVRAKLPAGRGSFPGIVTHGVSGDWPKGGEIGVMEQWGQDKSWFYASAYADSSANSGDKRSIRYDFANATTASSDFHVYSVDWTVDTMVFQVDGIEIMRTTFGTSSPFSTTAQYIIMNVAVGGNMGGTVDPDGFPMDMVVDYIRVYSR